MESKEKVALAIVSTLGFVALLVAVLHAEYLGFDLTFAYPIMLVGVVLTLLYYCLPNYASRLTHLTTPKRLLLGSVAIGGVLRIIMMLNPNAALDELTLYTIVAHNNVFDLVHFAASFNQIVGPFWNDTTPLTFIMWKLGYLVSPTLQGVRIIPVTLDVLLIPVVYYLAKEFASEKVAQFTAFLFAINPGALYFLGAADSDIFVTFFGMTGLLFFIRGYRRDSVKQLCVAVAMFGGAFWSKSSFPEIWIGVTVIFGLLFLGGLNRGQRIITIGLVVVGSVGLFAPWHFIDPSSFRYEFMETPAIAISQFVSPSTINLGGSGTVITSSVIPSVPSSIPSSITNATSQPTGSTSSGILGVLAAPNIIPKFVPGTGEFTAYADVLAQIPLWFGPMALILGIPLLVYSLIKAGRRWLHLALLLWLFGMLLTLLAIPRDIRYFVDIGTFPLLLLAAEAVGLERKDLSRAFEILLVVFAVVFLAIGCVTGYELNSGMSEASQFTNQNFPHGSIGVNYGELIDFAGHSQRLTVLPSNVYSLGPNLTSANYAAVIVWHQSRTIFVSDEYSSILDSHFAHHIDFGLSNFSYATVYYNNFTG